MEGYNLKFENASIYHNTLYFVDFDITFLFAYNFDEKRVKIVSKIPDLPVFYQRAFGNMVISEDKIYLIPLKIDKIWVYDIKNNIWKCVDLKMEMHAELLFRGAIDVAEKIYVAGYDEKCLFYINKNDLSVKFLNVNSKFGYGMTLYNSFLFIPLREKGNVLKVDIADDNFEEIELKYNKGFCDIVFFKDYFYLAPEHIGSLVRWKYNPKTGAFCEDIEELGESVSHISGVAVCGDTLIMATRHVDDSIELKNKEIIRHKGPSMFCYIKSFNDETILLCTLDGKVTRIVNDGIKDVFFLKLDKNEFQRGCELFNINTFGKISDSTLEENMLMSLEHYINIVKGTTK